MLGGPGGSAQDGDEASRVALRGHGARAFPVRTHTRALLCAADRLPSCLLRGGLFQPRGSFPETTSPARHASVSRRSTPHVPLSPEKGHT